MGSQSAVKPHPQLSKPTRRDPPPPLPPHLTPPPPPQNPNPRVPSPSRAASAAAATAPDSTTSSSSSLCVAAADDPALAATTLLSREEVLRRRSRRLKRLERLYRDQYWALAEEVRSKHREYYWNYGLSPTEEERGPAAGAEGNNGADAAVWEEEEWGRVNKVAVSQRSQCVFAGCKSKAMPLTRFCHPHILSDRNQTLYKACSYAIKSGQSGPITCGKPVLRAAIPSLCSLHLQKAKKHISHALKKAGFNPSSLSRSAPKFHVIITEYLHQIQSKRREAPNALTESNAEFDKNVS